MRLYRVRNPGLGLIADPNWVENRLSLTNVTMPAGEVVGFFRLRKHPVTVVLMPPAFKRRGAI